MTQPQSRRQRAVELITACLWITFCCPCVLILLGFRAAAPRRRRRGCVIGPVHGPVEAYIYPPHLPTNRINIGRRPLAEQPANCRLLLLPLEVRQCIYEAALGGRAICLKLVASRAHKHCVVQSTCYDAVEDSLNTLDVLADAIPTALLLSCRQVYLEALPILHRRNVFHFTVHEFQVVVLAALGRHCLPDIRSVYLCHSYRRNPYVPPWAAVFELLQQMRLDSLAFEFEVEKLQRTELGPGRSLLDSAWGSRVVHIRNLRWFEFFFKDGDPPEYPLYRINAVQRLQELMIGTEADRRYKMLLEERRRAEEMALPQ
ncbi:hypothetical protein C8R44DRAFT_789944 [Mycena epipterygia]|nr:hypothetical protein C8R44DRAFT_789944 [Mycena epipterygia]